MLLTIGHVAAALGRTTWSVKYWEQIGLLPPPAFILNRKTSDSRRRLYLDDYVDRLAEIASQEYVRGRLEYPDWKRFQRQALLAFKETVEPVLPAGVTLPLSVRLRKTTPGTLRDPVPVSTGTS